MNNIKTPNIERLTSTADRLATIKRPELLAPAGREDVFYAVLNAGADAVYLSGKQFNMRRHRKDFNFSNEALKRVVDYAHNLGRKVYITVNILIGEHELAELVEYLKFLETIAVDSIIIQDYGVIEICRKQNINIPLHSSTMMNVNSAVSALLLKEYGFTRVVTSRDITIDEVRRLAETAGIESEYFIHGDMCSVQSGQCHGSGIIFGKSSNRGQCMKPCRWSYDMVSETSGTLVKSNAYLLASKDLCLIEQLPELINAGIDSLKIEGRMKPAETLSRIVAVYRRAIDSYCDNPLGYHRDFNDITDIYNNRARDLSTGFAFKTPDDEFFDMGGEREPLFLSYSGKLHNITDWNKDIFSDNAAIVTNAVTSGNEISCVAGNMATAQAAFASGVDNLIISYEGDLEIDSKWDFDELKNLAEQCRDSERRFIFSTPKIITERELREFQYAVEMLGEAVDTYLVSGIAAIDCLRRKNKKIWIDSSCNVINSKAYDFFAELGCERVLPAIESSFDNLASMLIDRPQTSLDVMIHGPLLSMLVEHCLVGMNTQHISKRDFCKMPCQFEQFALVDRKGNRRIIHTDKFCRNHVMLEHDLCVLPSLNSFMKLGHHSFRIDARLYSPEDTAFLVKFYKETLNRPAELATQIAEFQHYFTDRKFSYGGYLRGITGDAKISLLDLKKEEKNEACCTTCG
ncbi:MAG: U32 family peptidase [Victivallaceae bacterium]|nr:U32 family peptidase [Victivallaceae bacterium]